MRQVWNPRINKFKKSQGENFKNLGKQIEIGFIMIKQKKLCIANFVMNKESQILLQIMEDILDKKL